MRLFNHLIILIILLAIAIGGCADMPQASLQQPAIRQGQHTQPAKPKKEQKAYGDFATVKMAELPLGTSKAARRLQEQINAVLSQKIFSRSQIGVYIVSPQTGQTLYERNAHVPLTPASNAKLFVTAAVLEAFTPEYHYETTLLTNGKVTPKGLEGDLIVRGSGDPSLSRRFLHHDPQLVFHHWAEDLKKHGIKTIYGDLVGDASLFATHGHYPGWLESDASLWYAAHTSTLVFNDNCVNLTVRRTKGSKLKTTLDPDTGLVSVQNRAVASSRRRVRHPLTIKRIPNGNCIQITGELPRKAKHRTRTITVHDPDNFFMSALSKRLRADGVSIKGRVRVEHDPDYLKRQPYLQALHIHRSPSLASLVEYTNKKSLNLYAEQFLKALGARFHTVGSRESGIRSLRSWLTSMGVPPDECNIQDGSGLSILNKVSPFALGMLLRHASGQNYFDILRGSLPVAGKDGTLRHRMRNTPAYGNVHAKTGYMKRVCSLSGYVTDADGHRIIFSIIANTHRNMPGRVKKAQNAICELLAAYSDAKKSPPPGGKNKTGKKK